MTVAQKQESQDGSYFRTMEEIATPLVARLDPADIVSLHEDEVFLSFRLALKRGLERAELLASEQTDDARTYIAEELRAAERAARMTVKTSKFVSERRKVGRDLVISTVVATGLIPVTGVSTAAAGVAAAVSRSALDLLWSWLRGQDHSNDGAVRCFSTFD